ncbi:phosphatidic acid phosphatase [Nocardioides flavus (ex Wang et al. 2016)]|uniref:Phosphatidic acid phosphatase n=1 Tax=Nocardioides flavus (ex Wang et al. 2016) TaxID=2058780 RepID=A0ABQ3HJ48_9ACTN|nr:phosphatase PAP2 family protein [Nocardioides flavus (ex Wang et al. 2016)]GHE15714.1 phosphatidic acid phosphatase [Nocardioides flavus (ex Wang et al. 2016)]
MTALVWLADRSQHTRLGQELDQAGMDIVAGDAAATRRLVGVLGNVSLGSIAVAVALLVGVAWVRRLYAAAVAAGALVLGANVTTQAMKALSERSDFGYLTVTSFPSGHSTVVVSLVLAALLVVPGQARVTVSLVGSAAVTVTAAATLVASWHRPADIVGAILVCLAWGTGVLTVWSLTRGGMPGTAPARQHRVFAVTGVGVALAGLLAVGVRPDTGWSGFLDAGVVLAGIALATALAVTAFAQLSAPMAAGAPVPRTGAGRHDD